MTAPADVVFLLDVDNTLLDNDHIIDDLRNHLEREFAGSSRSEKSSPPAHDWLEREAQSPWRWIAERVEGASRERFAQILAVLPSDDTHAAVVA